MSNAFLIDRQALLMITPSDLRHVLMLNLKFWLFWCWYFQRLFLSDWEVMKRLLRLSKGLYL